MEEGIIIFIVWGITHYFACRDKDKVSFHFICNMPTMINLGLVPDFSKDLCLSLFFFFSVLHLFL